MTYVIDSVANSGNTGTETKTYFAAYAGSECGGAWNNPIGLVPLSNGTHVIEYMGTGYGSTRFALITEQANATWKLKSFKIEEKRFTPKTSCGQHIPIDKDYNSNTTPLFTASTASTAVSVPATPTPKRVVITGSIAAGAAPAQFGASLSFSTTVGKVYTIYLENVSLETANLAPSYRNYTGYAVVNHPADAGDEGKMLTNGSLGYTSCYKGYAITFVARATTTWLMLGGMVAAQDAAQPATVSIRLQKLRIVGSQPIRRTVQLLADKGYRYSFNGQEKEPELGPGITGAPYWMYDSRSGRRWERDPKGREWESPYATFGGNPVGNKDPNGDSWYTSDGQNRIYFNTQSDLYVSNAGEIYAKVCDQWTETLMDGTQVEHVDFGGAIGAVSFVVGMTAGPQTAEQLSYQGKIKTVEAFSDAMNTTMLTTFYMAASAGTSALVSSLANASYEFIKQYSLNAGEMNKVDKANVVIQGVPLPKGMNALAGDIVKDLFQSAVDYTDGKFRSVFAGTKDLDIAGIEAASNIISTTVISKYNEQIQSAFKNTDPKYTKQMVEQVNKFATEFAKDILSNGMVDKYKQTQSNSTNKTNSYEEE